MELKNKELKRLNELYRSNLDRAGVQFFEGRGMVTGPHSVKVNGREFKVGARTGTLLSSQLRKGALLEQRLEHYFGSVFGIEGEN